MRSMESAKKICEALCFWAAPLLQCKYKEGSITLEMIGLGPFQETQHISRVRTPTVCKLVIESGISYSSGVLFKSMKL